MIATTLICIFPALCALGILVAILLPEKRSPLGLAIIGSIESIAAGLTSTQATCLLRCFACFSWACSYEAAGDIGYSW